MSRGKKIKGRGNRERKREVEERERRVGGENDKYGMDFGEERKVR